jgi:hypothetical protein
LEVPERAPATRGTIGSVPVFNVALPMKREFWLFELNAYRPRGPEYALIG